MLCTEVSKFLLITKKILKEKENHMENLNALSTSLCSIVWFLQLLPQEVCLGLGERCVGESRA